MCDQGLGLPCSISPYWLYTLDGCYLGTCFQRVLRAEVESIRIGEMLKTLKPGPQTRKPKAKLKPMASAHQRQAVAKK